MARTKHFQTVEERIRELKQQVTEEQAAKQRLLQHNIELGRELDSVRDSQMSLESKVAELEDDVQEAKDDAAEQKAQQKYYQGLADGRKENSRFLEVIISAVTAKVRGDSGIDDRDR